MTFKPATHPILTLPYNALYKKPTRTQTLAFKVIDSLKALSEERLLLTRVSFMLISIFRLYIVKVRYVLADTSDLISSFIKTKEKARRNLPMTNFPFLIDVNMCDYMVEESVMDARDSLVLDYIPDFSMNEIEVGRNNESIISEKGISLLTNTLQPKRVIDDAIEHSQLYLKIKSKNHEREVNTPIEALQLPNELDEFFKKIKRDEVENMRAERSVDYDIDMFAHNISDIQLESVPEESVDSEEFQFENVFIFNEFVARKDRKYKSMCFVTILNHCTNGRMKCDQENPYDYISCKVLLPLNPKCSK